MSGASAPDPRRSHWQTPTAQQTAAQQTGQQRLDQIWALIAPGRYRREKRWTYLFAGAAAPLFAAGAVLAFLFAGIANPSPDPPPRSLR